MSVITLDEQNRKRIQKFLKQEIGFYGYEQDIELLQQNGQLTESLARKVFTEIMNDNKKITDYNIMLYNIEDVKKFETFINSKGK